MSISAPLHWLRRAGAADCLCPSDGENALAACSLDDFRKLQPAFEKNGVQIDRSPRSVLKGLTWGISSCSARCRMCPPSTSFLLRFARSGMERSGAMTPGAYPCLRRVWFTSNLSGAGFNAHSAGVTNFGSL